MKLPHQVLGAAFGRVRAPGARTAAPKVKNCRTGATMLMQNLCTKGLEATACCSKVAQRGARLIGCKR